MAPSYFGFAVRNRRFLAFGLLMTFGSCFGQTHFIGVFGPSIQAEFGLSHASWGTIYMAGTLMSAALLPFTGRWIDRISLRRYAVLVCIGLTFACLAAAAAPAAWFLIIVIFLLRQTGQGLASHTAITGMVKYFRHNRGKAIALALLGHPVARAVMPLGAVVAIAASGWRETYIACAVLAAVVMLPLGVAILILACFDHPAWAWVYLGVSGFASGVRATIIPAMWAERCGARHIGAIKSLATTLSVFGSAFGPPLMGWAMDAGIQLQTMIYVTVAYMLLASVALCFASRLRD